MQTLASFFGQQHPTLLGPTCCVRLNGMPNNFGFAHAHHTLSLWTYPWRLQHARSCIIRIRIMAAWLRFIQALILPRRGLPSLLSSSPSSGAETVEHSHIISHFSHANIFDAIKSSRGFLWVETCRIIHCNESVSPDVVETCRNRLNTATNSA